MLRPWLAADMPALLREMEIGYPQHGLWPNRTTRPDRRTWTGPRYAQEAWEWLDSQDRGWRDGDWLTFAVLEQVAPGDGHRLAGHVGLKGGGPGDRVGQQDRAEVAYWTVTGWAFDRFGATGLRQLQLVHSLDNIASCRVAGKSGYAFQRISPAKPPLYGAAHIHVRPAL
jgi:RimJ/RimL family protein N-acetyltransferase